VNVLNNMFWTQPDSRLVFIYHGLGIVTGVRWPTGTSSKILGVSNSGQLQRPFHGGSSDRGERVGGAAAV
jgi:hypothetical protein